jgi:hypothetical protein
MQDLPTSYDQEFECSSCSTSDKQCPDSCEVSGNGSRYGWTTLFEERRKRLDFIVYMRRLPLRAFRLRVVNQNRRISLQKIKLHVNLTKEYYLAQV